MDLWIIYDDSGTPSYGQVVYNDGKTCMIVAESGRFAHINPSFIKESHTTKESAINSLYNTYKRKDLDEDYVDFDEIDRQVEERLNKAVNAYYSLMRAQEYNYDEASTPIDEQALIRTCQKTGMDPGILRKEIISRMRSFEGSDESVKQMPEQSIKATEAGALDSSLLEMGSYIITRAREDGTDEVIYRIEGTLEQARKAFRSAIDKQCDAYHIKKTLKEWRTLRLFDSDGKQIAQES